MVYSPYSITHWAVVDLFPGISLFAKLLPKSLEPMWELEEPINNHKDWIKENRFWFWSMARRDIQWNCAMRPSPCSKCKQQGAPKHSNTPHLCGTCLSSVVQCHISVVPWLMMLLSSEWPWGTLQSSTPSLSLQVFPYPHSLLLPIAMNMPNGETSDFSKKKEVQTHC